MVQSEIKRLAKRVYYLPSRIRARFKNKLMIKYKGLTLNFATQSPIAKRWFYPRYISGDRLHEPPIASLIRSVLGPRSTFFDVGANLGFFTVLAANICTTSEGSVHAFELDPALIPLIEESLDLNEQCGRVFLNCVACAQESGRFHTFRAAQEANPSTNRVVLSEGKDQVTSVQAMTTSLDHYCQSTGTSPDLIKMDIEGAEALAVTGMLEMIETHTPKLILEVHPEAVRQFGSTPTSLIEMLRRAGDYSEVMRIKSYRRDEEHRDEILSELKLDSFDESRGQPVVLFFRS